jgi:hypothetical protein
MRILHALSQRPEATGSGIYVRGMAREAFRAGHENFLLAGIPAEDEPQLECLTDDHVPSSVSKPADWTFRWWA